MDGVCEAGSRSWCVLVLGVSLCRLAVLKWVHVTPNRLSVISTENGTGLLHPFSGFLQVQLVWVPLNWDLCCQGQCLRAQQAGSTKPAVRTPCAECMDCVVLP
jgi:hypothetical protein